MKRDYLGHTVVLALALAGSAVMIKKCPPEPVPAGQPAPSKPPVVEAPKAEAVAPAVIVPFVPAAPAPEAKAEGRGL
jgi:hypothetical protein